MAGAELFIKRPTDFSNAGKDVVKSPEARNGAFKFTLEAKAALLGLNYKIIPLTGESILDYRNKGAKLVTDWHKGKDYEKRTTVNSEIAIPPDILIKDSNNKPLSEQKNLLKKRKEELTNNEDSTKNVNGIDVIMGKSPENVAIAHIITGESNGNANPLAGKAVRCDEESPISSENHSFGVTVRIDSEDGILITDRDTRGAKRDVFILPIIVPASASEK